MNIWLVSIFEQTPIDNVFSTRFLSIADEALNRGHQVTFFGSTFKHNTKEQRFNDTTEVQQAENYKLVFIKSKGYRKNVSLKRLWSHYEFSKVAVRTIDQYPRPDVILVAFPPISLAYELARWAKAKGIPLIMDVIDPWPDIFEKVVPDQLAFIPKLFFQPQKHKLRQTLKNINQLTGISHQYLDWAKSYYSPIASTECLYPAADYHKIREMIEENKTSDKEGDEELNVIYAGSLASSYDIKCILEAAEQLAGKPIHFYIAGAGEQEKAIQAYTQKRDNLTFLGRLPKDRLMSYYAHAHLGLTQHVKGATQSVTYKLFDLLSAGLPVLNSLESEMKDIILDNKVGLHNDPGDSKQLAENIAYFYNNPAELEQYKANCLELARNVGDTRVIYNRFVDLLEENANL